MAKKVFVNLNMFTINQDVIVVEGNQAKPVANVPIDRVGEMAASFANELHADEIEIHGNKEYAEQVVYDIKEFLDTKYNKNVRITVNGEVCD